jgi:hypothetical protein
VNLFWEQSDVQLASSSASNAAGRSPTHSRGLGPSSAMSVAPRTAPLPSWLEPAMRRWGRRSAT